jgi:hypothetical protein
VKHAATHVIEEEALLKVEVSITMTATVEEWQGLVRQMEDPSKIGNVYRLGFRTAIRGALKEVEDRLRGAADKVHEASAVFDGGGESDG